MAFAIYIILCIIAAIAGAVVLMKGPGKQARI